MLKRFLEWGASLSRPRFKAYMEARRRYEAYLAKCVRARTNPLNPQERRRAKEASELKEAALLYREAIQLSEQEGAGGDAAAASFQLGILLHLQGEVEEASTMFRKTAALLDDLPKIERQQQAIRSGCLYHLGLIAWHDHHDAGQALHHIQAALDIDVVNNNVQSQKLCQAALKYLQAQRTS